MSRRRFFNVVCMLFLWAAVVDGSYVSYVTSGPAFSPIPYYRYESSKVSPMLSGYSYETQDISGASSVTFMTGPNSAKNFNKKTAATDKVMTMTMLENDMQDQKIPTPMPSPVNQQSQKMETQDNMKPAMTSKMNTEPMERQTAAQQLSYVQSSIFQQNSNLHLPTVPQFYILPSALSNSYYTPNGFAPLGITPYAFRNPLIQFLNPPYLSLVNTFPSTPTNKASEKPSKITDKNITSNCTKSQDSNVNSQGIKVTPASEYVANAIDRITMKGETTNTMAMENKMEKIMDSDVQIDMSTLNNTKAENKNTTMAMQKEADQHMETMEVA